MTFANSSSVVRSLYGNIFTVFLALTLTACSSESSDDESTNASTSGSNGTNGANGSNGRNGANCFDAAGTTDLNNDGVINVQDCRGPQGPQGLQGLQGATGATGPAGPAGIGVNGWKLLAKGVNWTRIAEHRLNANGITTWLSNVANYNDGDQKIDTFMSQWPSVQPTEIIFFARNTRQNFCMGGSETNTGVSPAIFNVDTGATTNSYCADVRVRPGTAGQPIHVYNNTGNQQYWIRPVINGTIQMNCPSQIYGGRTAGPGTHPGILGAAGYFGVTCHFSRAEGEWTGDLNSIHIQEVGRGGKTSWEWEIYYR